MSNLDVLIVWLIIGGWAIFTMTFNDVQHDKIITSIVDHGCASYQPPAPEHKTNIEVYNLDSLKGNN